MPWWGEDRSRGHYQTLAQRVHAHASDIVLANLQQPAAMVGQSGDPAPAVRDFVMNKTDIENILSAFPKVFHDKDAKLEWLLRMRRRT